MLIKEENKLQVGQIITYPVTFCDIERGGNYTTENLDLIATEIYSHHVLFRCISYPNKKVDVTNTDLWLHGIYKSSDRLINIDPEKCINTERGGLKFFGKQI